MTREDIIQMAREAGMEQDGENFFSPSHEEIDVHITDLERFAQLVAAAEREACAKLVDDIGMVHEVSQGADLCFELATAIRARGQA